MPTTAWTNHGRLSLLSRHGDACVQSLRPPWSLLQVRAWLGIQEQPDAAALDSFNRLIAIMFCCYALWIAVTGRRM